jgi:McbB family protein
MMKYSVNNFVYHKLPSDNIVIQNQKGIVKINNKELIDLIVQVDMNNNRQLSKDEIAEFLGSQTDAAIDFLMNYQIIQEYKNYNFNVKNIKFFSNNYSLNNNLSKHIIELKNDVDIDFTIIQNLETQFNQSDLVIVFLNPYDKNLANQIRDNVQKSGDCLLLMTYIYNSRFYMDSLYNPKWKNPCHHCHMGYIESQLRMNEYGNLSYQSLIDIIYQEDNSFKVEAPLSTIDLYNIIVLIFNHLDKHVFRTKGRVLFLDESLDEINSTTVFNLENKAISKDTSIHWELCDCYE